MIAKAIRTAAVLAALVVAGTTCAAAHNLAMSVYPFGDTIDGEVYFSDGVFPENALIEVFGPDGEKIGETTTNDVGYFTYTPTQPVAHRFYVDLGSGHVDEEIVEPADFTIGGVPANEIAAGGGAAVAADAAGEPAVSGEAAPALTDAAAVVAGASLDEIQAMVAAEFSTRIQPLVTALNLEREAAGFKDMMAGLGFIIGLVGIGFFFVARQQLSKAHASPAAAGENGAEGVSTNLAEAAE